MTTVTTIVSTSLMVVLAYMLLVVIGIPMFRKKAIVLSSKIGLLVGFFTSTIFMINNSLFPAAIIALLVIAYYFSGFWLVLNTSKTACIDAIRKITIGLNLDSQFTPSKITISSQKTSVHVYGTSAILVVRIHIDEITLKNQLIRKLIKKYITA